MSRDTLARIIGAAIWQPQPDMSGDVWAALGPARRQQCERAAEAVLEAAHQDAADRAIRVVQGRCPTARAIDRERTVVALRRALEEAPA